MANRLSYTNSNRIKSEIFSDYCNIYNIVDEEISFSNLNWTESESCSNQCDVVGKEIPFMEEIQWNHSNPNYSKSKYYSDNVEDNNRNIEKEFGNKEL